MTSYNNETIARAQLFLLSKKITNNTLRAIYRSILQLDNHQYSNNLITHILDGYNELYEQNLYHHVQQNKTAGDSGEEGNLSGPGQGDPEGPQEEEEAEASPNTDQIQRIIYRFEWPLGVLLYHAQTLKPSNDCRKLLSYIGERANSLFLAALCKTTPRKPPPVLAITPNGFNNLLYIDYLLGRRVLGASANFDNLLCGYIDPYTLVEYLPVCLFVRPKPYITTSAPDNYLLIDGRFESVRYNNIAAIIQPNFIVLPILANTKFPSQLQFSGKNKRALIFTNFGSISKKTVGIFNFRVYRFVTDITLYYNVYIGWFIKCPGNNLESFSHTSNYNITFKDHKVAVANIAIFEYDDDPVLN
jgi:hypothetical protein